MTDSDDTTSTPDENKGNPSTGASDMINAAVAAAFAGLAGVGALSAKKRSK